MLPSILGEDARDEAVYQVIGDLVKYINSSRHYRDRYDALMGFEEDAIQHYLKNQFPGET